MSYWEREAELAMGETFAEKCKRLEAELAELRADKERLDWLEKYSQAGRFPVRRYIGESPGWAIRDILGNVSGEGLTLRAAIDAARGAK